MLPRERVMAAFNHQEPDRLPMDLGCRVSTMALPLYAQFQKHLGYGDLETRVLDLKANIADLDEPILEKFQIDTRYVYPGPPDTWKLELIQTPGGTTMVDEWGASYRKPEDGFYFDMIGHPFKEADPTALDRHSWPDPDDPTRYAGLRERAKDYYDRGYIVGSAIKGVWETLWVLRGIEKVMTDMYAQPGFFHALAERTAEIQAATIKNLLAETSPYVQFVCVTCDLATQNAIMVSRDFFRKFIRPYESKIFQAIRDGGARVALHSCGAVTDMIPELIEAGVEILNPIQTSAKNMDTKKLKQEYGSDLCFWGGVDVQQVLAFGSAEEVRQETRRVIEDFSPGGGYLFAPSHDVQVNTPIENVMAMLEAALELGGKA